MEDKNKVSKFTYTITEEGLSDAANSRLQGLSFREVVQYIPDKEQAEQLLQKLRHKGNLGELIEEALGLSKNSEQRPDFDNLGVELKVTPVEKTSKGTWKAGERLVITMISYDPEDNTIDGRNRTFPETHLAEKLRCILLCVYLRPAKHKGMSRQDYIIKKVTLFTPPEEDMPVIKRDWEHIMAYVYAGRADELSEGQTEYLGACTKGVDGKHMKPQKYPPYKPAKPRAFCLKTSYMTYLENEYIMKDRQTYVPSQKLGNDFEAEALKRMNRFKGMNDSEITAILGFDRNRNTKHYHSLLSFAMMGLSSNSCEEFTKANIVMKTLRFENTGVLKESISLPIESFLSVLDENDFDDSALCDYFESSRFFLSIWQKEPAEEGKSEVCRFVGAAFWAMPGNDIYGPLKDCWEKTKHKLMNGVKFTPEFKSNGKVEVHNNLPGMGDSGSIAHVRPHASKSFHIIKGRVYANDSSAGKQNAFILPIGECMTKQSFWLNSELMTSVVKSLDIKI